MVDAIRQLSPSIYNHENATLNCCTVLAQELAVQTPPYRRTEHWRVREAAWRTTWRFPLVPGLLRVVLHRRTAAKTPGVRE